VKKGRFDGDSTPADIAPSLGALAGIPFRTIDGHARTEAFTAPLSTR
jgi:hypothetical protein